MGWYLRKSFGFGPLRVNLSKSGVGYSLGVPGARIGTNSRGTYIRMGLGGVYYQKYLDAGSAPQSQRPTPAEPATLPEPELENVITTASASSLKDSSATELLQEITSCHQKPLIAPWLIGIAALAAASVMAAGLPTWEAIGIVLVGAAGHFVATRADYRRKVMHLDYELEPAASQAYVALLEGLENLRRLGGLWRISSSESNADTKYHAGAQISVNRHQIGAAFEPPRYIVTQTAVFALNAGPQRLYFLPDRILVYEGDQVGAVAYENLTVKIEKVSFVEGDSVPGDAQIIGKTWRYTNKRGGPDRRFANNPELPVVRYAEVGLQSSSGLNYLIQASNLEKSQLFVQAVRNYCANKHLAISN
jgi:hypothetical protein